MDTESIKNTQENLSEGQSETKVESSVVDKEIAADFAEFADKAPVDLKNNIAFRTLAAEAMQEALSNLPTKKYLKQEFEASPSNDIYTETIGKIFDDFEQIPAGQGAEYCLVNGIGVNLLDPNKFIPSERNDIDNYSYFASITIPSDIKQVELSIADWKYVEYFLSGKVNEFANVVKNELEKSIKLKQCYDSFQLLKEIFAKTYAKTSSTEEAPTNHLAGTTSLNLVDAVREFMDFKFDAHSHNQVFAYDTEAFKGYNNLVESDIRIICSKQTYHNMRKIATTFLTSDELLKLSSFAQWVVLPTSIFNPTTKKVEKLDIFVDSEGKRVKGALMFVSRSGLKRLYNLENVYNEFFPKNLTNEAWANARYTQGILPWTQVGIYNNEALESNFVIPTKEQA